MRITESKLRRIIRSVIKESDDHRLSSEFQQQVGGIIDEFKEHFIDACNKSSSLLSPEALKKLKDDWFVEKFLEKYLTDTVYMNGEHNARRHFEGLCRAPVKAFIGYVDSL